MAEQSVAIFHIRRKEDNIILSTAKYGENNIDEISPLS